MNDTVFHSINSLSRSVPFLESCLSWSGSVPQLVGPSLTWGLSLGRGLSLSSRAVLQLVGPSLTLRPVPWPRSVPFFEGCPSTRRSIPQLALNSLNRAIFYLFVNQKAILCCHVLFLDCIERVKLAWPTNDQKSRARPVINAVSYRSRTRKPHAQKRNTYVLPLAAYFFYCYFSLQQMLLKQYTLRDQRKIHRFVHTVWLTKAFLPSSRRLLTSTSFPRLNWRALDNISNYDRIQLSRPCHSRCSLGEICDQRLRHAPLLLDRRTSLACCETNARQSVRRHLRRRRFPPAALPCMLCYSLHQLHSSLIISTPLLLIPRFLTVDVHSRHRLHPRGRRSCSEPHAHSASPEPLLRCVTAGNHLPGRWHTTLCAERHILVGGWAAETL